ncbi:T-cell surface glycoprotein CD3 delta chain [Rhea pennata]|uniref:T-cell surface glycoprotein CD3 delta chain n=1 Tax=Rhea pennata TaxID=8795 RepID=UPI002E2635EB
MRPRRAPGGRAPLAGLLLLLPLLPLARGEVRVREAGGRVALECGGGAAGAVSWWRDGSEVGNGSRLELGSAYDDPRGVYTCQWQGGSASLQVHYRMCQNCIEVDAATVSGIVVADVVATVFLAIAVYCITGHDQGRMSRASDRQNLIANEQLYQPLGERDDGQYSRLAPVKARK